MLDELGVRRRVQVRVTGWLPLPFVVAGTGLVAIVPERLAHRAADPAGVLVVERLRADGFRVASDDIDVPDGDDSAVPVDVTDPDSAVAMCARVLDRWGRVDVLVNCVVPGVLDVRLTDKAPEEERRLFLSRIPMGRMGQPTELRSLCPGWRPSGVRSAPVRCSTCRAAGRSTDAGITAGGSSRRRGFRAAR